MSPMWRKLVAPMISPILTLTAWGSGEIQSSLFLSLEWLESVKMRVVLETSFCAVQFVRIPSHSYELPTNRLKKQRVSD